MPPFRPLEETSSNTSETLRNPSKNIIRPLPESVDSEGNKVETDYDGYNDKKRRTLFYLGNNTLSGLQQSQESPSKLNASIQSTVEVVKPNIEIIPLLARLSQFEGVYNPLSHQSRVGTAHQPQVKHTPEQIQDILNSHTEPARNLELTPDNWKQEFGEKLTAETPIGKVKWGDNQYEKLITNKRGQ